MLDYYLPRFAPVPSPKRPTIGNHEIGINNYPLPRALLYLFRRVFST